jgi:hypothetical protein
MVVEFTAFPSIFDNKTHRRFSFEDWNHFSGALLNMAKKPGYKPKKGEKSHLKPSPLITPAVYEKGTTRANANVIKWAGWCALDIDEYDTSFKEAVNQFKEYEYVCYSTASSTKEKPKFRIVFKLDEDIENEKIKHFWYALNKEFNSIGDPQTKDLSRMYYIPALYPNSYNFCFTNKGKILNPKELMDKHDYVDNSGTFLSKLPVEMQRQILQHRKDSLTNDDYTWTSYHDCKFVHKRLVEEYRAITETGWYHKMYQIMISIAGSAIKYKYPITATDISILCRQIDLETGGWYKNRPIEKEAQRALEYVLSSEL